MQLQIEEIQDEIILVADWNKPVVTIIVRYFLEHHAIINLPAKTLHELW